MGQWVLCNRFNRGNLVNFLVDSGSTSTLLSSQFYQSINAEIQIPLCPVTKKLKDLNGNNLVIQGSADIKIQFKQNMYEVPAPVCNITQDAILGRISS
jgi:hypothetical protein